MAILALRFCLLSEAKMTDYGKMNVILNLHFTAILAHELCLLSEAKTTDYGKINGNLIHMSQLF